MYQDESMKKVIIVCLGITFIIVLTFGWTFYHFMWDTQSISKGELLRTEYSPKKRYCANVYRGEGGATVDDSIVVEIEDKKMDTRKNIYFEYHKDDVKVQWLNETKIKIDEKELNILKDVYDWRHH